MSSGEVCQNHGLKICSRCVVVTDAAKRMSDMINAMLTFHNPWEIRNQWMAFRLADGTSDGALYDSKADAIRHVSDYNYWCFFSFRNVMGGANPKDCQLFLNMHRHAYDNGGQLTDPDASPNKPTREFIVPAGYYDWMNEVRRPQRPW